jgi:voltage-gated potassium channel
MAVATMRQKGHDPKRIVVIDERADARQRATDDGITAIAGNASVQQTLLIADCPEASSVIVAVDRDDAAVLIALTARELNPDATIVASVREEENVHLLHQSGANAVITSSGAAGRLLGLSSETPQVSEVLEDLLSVGEGLDINEREVGADEIGPIPGRSPHGMILAIVRDGELMRFDDPRASDLRDGDRVIELLSHKVKTT